jgi:hypothetical protein
MKDTNMKISELLTEAARSIPFTVTYQYEWDDPTRDEDLDPYEQLSIDGFVSIERNMYGVRGGPDGYEVKITDVTDSNGNPFSLDKLHPREVARIKQEAIDQVVG